MSWRRSPVAAALVQVLSTAGLDATVFANPPTTLNPPCVVVGRETNVNLATAGYSVDEATLPVAVVGPMDGDDVVDYLRDQVRKTIDANPTLGGAVPSCHVTNYRNSRNVTVAGVEILAVDLILTIRV
jgi:hypothetical protein